jgi:hypothetical protein
VGSSLPAPEPGATARRSPKPTRTSPEPQRIGTLERRATLDTIVQSSVVDLFHANKIAVAPVERVAVRPERVQLQELAAQIHFFGRGFTGTMTLGVPTTVFATIGHETGRRFDGRDWIREMTNQVFGRLKRRLLQFQVQLNASLPSALTREAFERELRRPGFMVYPFRTLRGEVLLTLSGDIDHSQLAYAHGAAVLNDGDVILF